MPSMTFIGPMNHRPWRHSNDHICNLTAGIPTPHPVEMVAGPRWAASGSWHSRYDRRESARADVHDSVRPVAAHEQHHSAPEGILCGEGQGKPLHFAAAGLEAALGFLIIMNPA